LLYAHFMPIGNMMSTYMRILRMGAIYGRVLSESNKSP